MTKKINIPQVTLVAMGSTDVSGMVNALIHSMQGIQFGSVKLVTDKEIVTTPSIEIRKCEPINSIDEWNRAIVFDLGGYIDTDYAILIHPDGYVVNPESWNGEWLNYDYIGAPWPLPSPTDSVSYRDIKGEVRRVGNSVSLRSKRLLNLPKELNMEWKAYNGFFNEDGYICVNNVHVFEENGCKIAPIEVAKYFSREHDMKENVDVGKPFCFHRNWGRNIVYNNYENS